MRHILSLFGRSPFAPLQEHMLTVSHCVEKLDPLFAALKIKDTVEAGNLCKEIGELEHSADKNKNHIRNHLPNSLMLSIDRATFLDMLSTQDAIADAVEDVSVVVMVRELVFLPEFEPHFDLFLKKNISCFLQVKSIIAELHQLMESSFGGAEAKKVKVMCDDVAFQEHEADVIQTTLLTTIYSLEKNLSYAAFYQWQEVLKTVGSVANSSETLANFVRMTLDIN